MHQCTALIAEKAICSLVRLLRNIAFLLFSRVSVASWNYKNFLLTLTSTKAAVNNVTFVSGCIHKAEYEKTQKNVIGSRKYRHIDFFKEKDGICCTIPQYFYLTVAEPLDVCKYFLRNNGSVFLVIMTSSTSELSTSHFGSKKGKDNTSTPK